MMSLSSSPTPYAVVCRDHGRQYLTEKSYDLQMSNPWALWRCPVCGDDAQWDDETYERWLDIVEELQACLFPPKALPPAYLTFTMAVGQRWRINELHALPLGLCWIKEQSPYEPCEAAIFMGVYRATLEYSRANGDFVTVAIHEVRNLLRRHELWIIAGRSLSHLLAESSQGVQLYKEGLGYRPFNQSWQHGFNL